MMATMMTTTATPTATTLESRTMRQQMTGTASVLIALVGVMAMSACGTQKEPDAAATPNPGAPTAASSPAADQGDAALERRAKSRFVPLSALGKPWRESQPPPVGFGLTVCGVDIEPEATKGSARQRFAQTGVGPFLSQYVQVHRDGLADEVVTKLRAALPTCTTFETKGESASSPVTTFVVEKTTFDAVPANTVVWRMTSQGERKVTQDVALVADGEFLVGLVSYRAGQAPDPAVITTAANAVPTGE